MQGEWGCILMEQADADCILDYLQHSVDVAWQAKHRVIEIWLGPDDWEKFIACLKHASPDAKYGIDFGVIPVKLRLYTTLIVEPK